MSPDGKWLAFTRYDLSRRVPTLLVQRLGADGAPHGAPAPVPGVPAGIVLSPTWSPNSRHLVFVRGQQVFDWQVGRSARLVYTANGSLGQMSMTWKNGRARAVATKADPNPDIWDLALDPATHAALGAPRRTVESTALEQHPQFSPDGRELAFMSRRSGHDAIWLAAADGGSPRQLTFLEAEVLGYPAWSPDGRRVAFHASTPGQRRTMYVTDAGGGIERRLFEGCCASWSHDGEYLYVTEVAEAGKANAVSRVRVADGARERLAVGDLAIETADGTRLLYSKEFERGLFARSLQGDVASNAEEKLVDDYIPMLGGFAAVDDGVFYLSHTEQGLPRAFSFYDFRTRAARDVLPAPASVWFGLTVSPDLKHLLYASGSPESGTDLVLFEFE
jgi:Tol biopolymer transport system component